MSLFAADIEQLDRTTRKVRIHRYGVGLMRSEVHRLWADDAAFSAAFSQTLADMPFDAFFWETPPLTPATFDAPFECVLKDAPSLARFRADRYAFESELEAAESDVATFVNLGGDAELVAPKAHPDADYAHLASFLRTAPPPQVAELWRRVAEAAGPWLAKGRPFWISTSGLGVAWLHVRLDTRPKYDSHAPYKAV